MTTKIRTTLLTAFFFFGLLTGLQAQDKYEFAKVYSITMGTKADGIYVQITGKEMEKIELKWDKNSIAPDFTPFLNYIQTMTDKGWEVITVDGGSFYLKRKKN